MTDNATACRIEGWVLGKKSWYSSSGAKSVSRHWASWKKRFCRSEKGLLSIGSSPTDKDMITCALRYYHP